MSLLLISLVMGKAPSLVNTTTIKKGSINPLETFIGSIEFSKNAKVASQGSGAVIEINFEAGDSVKTLHPKLYTPVVKSPLLSIP